MWYTRKAMTIIELVVVLGLMTTLVGLLLPAIQSVRGAASRAECQNHLRQIAVAIHQYETRQGCFPSTGGYATTNRPATPQDLLGWMVQILPDIDQVTVWQTAVDACRDEPLAYLMPPHMGNQAIIKAYICSGDDRLASPVQTPKNRLVSMTSYIGVGGAYRQYLRYMSVLPGIFHIEGIARVSDISDGLSNTVMVGERPPPDTYQAGEWYQTAWIRERYGGPNGAMYSPQSVLLGDPCQSGKAMGPGTIANPCDRLHFWSLHSGGVNFAFAHGSVRFLRHSSSDLIPTLMTMSGGEEVHQFE